MIPIGHAFGFPVTVDFTALIVLLLIGLQGAQSGTEGLVRGVLYALTIFGSVLVHELGHAFMARRYQLHPIAITLHGFGGLTSHGGVRSPKQGLILTFAGPLAGLALGLVAVAGVFAVNPIGNDELSSWVVQLAVINVFWSVFNLVPMYPLDGGWILFHLLAWKWPQGKALRWTAWVSAVMAVGVALLAWEMGQPFIGIVAGLSLMRAVRILTG